MSDAPSLDVRPRSLAGPCLETACKVDAVVPGFLTRLLYASKLRRMVTFAAFAELDLDQPSAVAARLSLYIAIPAGQEVVPLTRVGYALTTLSEREIVQALYGSVPDGFIGLLARLGGQPLPDPSDYRLAFSLFADPAHRARAKLLRQIPGFVSPTKIAAAAHLDAVLLHPAVLARMCDAERVAALNAALNIIRTVVPDATDEALHQSLDGLGLTGPALSKWVMGWLHRAHRLPAPVTPPISPGDPQLRLLHGRDMTELGRRFQNCAADRVGHLGLGSRIFYEWIGSDQSAVVELRCLSGGHFVIEDLKGIRNAEPDPAVTQAICKRLSEAGVLSYQGAGGHGAGNTLRHLLKAWDCEFIEADATLSELLDEAA